MRRLKNILPNVALLVASVAMSYLAAELAFFRILAPTLSPTIRTALSELPDTAWQTSKRGHLPADFIALLGDSYAEGIGDWLFSQRHPVRYGSAHVLHELTGTDVISLGRWGTGSPQSMVRKPARVLLDRSCFLLPQLDRPKHMVVYFYEGNDLHDNAAWALARFPVADGNVSKNVARFLADDYGVVPWWRCHSYFALVLKDAFKMAWTRLKGEVINPARAQAADRQRNRISSGGKILDAPPMLGALYHPGDREGELAVAVFDESLAWLRRRFADVPVTIVYLPSPAAVYRYEDEAAVIKQAIPFAQSVTALYADSQRLCERIRSVTTRHGASFIDARPALREAANRIALHGPSDWDHFNEAGYQLLGRMLAEGLGKAGTPCGA